MEIEAGMGFSRQWKRKGCPHCCENVSKLTYYSHRAWYIRLAVYRACIRLAVHVYIYIYKVVSYICMAMKETFLGAVINNLGMGILAYKEQTPT